MPAVKKSFKKNMKKRFTKKKAAVQWYRPGHGRMMTYKRVGARYFPIGNQRSQYKPRKQKYLAFIPPRSAYPLSGHLTEGSGSMDLETSMRPLVLLEASQHGFGGVAGRRAKYSPAHTLMSIADGHGNYRNDGFSRRRIEY